MRIRGLFDPIFSRKIADAAIEELEELNLKAKAGKYHSVAREFNRLDTLNHPSHLLQCQEKEIPANQFVILYNIAVSYIIIHPV